MPWVCRLVGVGLLTDLAKPAATRTPHKLEQAENPNQSRQPRKPQQALSQQSLSIPIIQPLGGIITALCNSSLWQKITLTWGDTTITFEGVGKGTAMKLADGSTVFQMVPSLQDYTMEVQFHYAEAGAEGPFFNAIVEEPIYIPNRFHTQILISADVVMEHVNNDAMLLINYERLNKTTRTPVPKKTMAAPSAIHIAR